MSDADGVKKVHELEIRVAQRDAYLFEVGFGGSLEPAAMDEPPPLGKGSAPNAARFLAAAIGNCLAASMVFCLGKQGAKVERGIEARVKMEIVRTPERRLRVGRVAVTLVVPREVEPAALEACRATFEDFCTVTQSVRRGIAVEVVVTQA
jgi:uncharacterized OsmC-like protein